MDSWEILGIQPTDNIHDIKRAYTKLIRIYNPEDDPDGFMRLRAAYEQACQAAPFIQQKGRADIADSGGKDVRDESAWGEADVFFALGAERGLPPITFDDPNPDMKFSVIQDIETLYNDFWRRIDINEWKKLLNGLNVHELYAVRTALSYFLTPLAAMPQAVWHYLESVLALSDDSHFAGAALLSENAADFDLCPYLVFLFKEDTCSGIKISEYADNYVGAYFAWHNYDLYRAGKLAKEALKVRPDAYMYAILGDAEAAQGNEAKAHEAYAAACRNKPMLTPNRQLARRMIELEHALSLINKRQYRKRMAAIGITVGNIKWEGIQAGLFILLCASVSLMLFSVLLEHMALPTATSPTAISISEIADQIISNTPLENYDMAMTEEALGYFAVAAQFLRAAAVADLPQALVRLGDYHVLGLGVALDYTTARAYYARAMTLGYTPANAKYVEVSLFFDATEINPEELFALVYQASAGGQGGDVLARLVLGRFFIFGFGTEPDIDRAISIFEGLIEQGNTTAKANLAMAYMMKPTSPDVAEPYTEKVLRLTQEAADAGDLTAMYNLSLFYRNGIFVERDEARADALHRDVMTIMRQEGLPLFGGIYFGFIN